MFEKMKNFLKKREEKRNSKEPSILYLVFCIDMLVCLVFYRYVGWIGLFLSEGIILGCGLYIHWSVNQQVTKEEKASGIKIIDTMSDEDFTNFSVNYMLADKYYSSDLDINEVDNKRFRIVIDNDEELLIYCIKSKSLAPNQVNELYEMMSLKKISKGLIVTNGLIPLSVEGAGQGQDITFLDRDFFMKNSDKDKIKMYTNSNEYTYVRICPECNSKLQQQLWFTGKRFKCTSKKCDFAIASRHLK